MIYIFPSLKGSDEGRVLFNTMIIDFHTHCFMPDVIKDRKKYTADPHFGMLNSNKNSRLADHVELVRMCDEFGIDHGVAMGFPWYDPDMCREHNRYFGRLRDLTRGRVLAFGSVPLMESGSVDSWISRIAELGLSGIGEVAFYRDGMNDENFAFLEKIFRGAEKHGLPVCLHVNEPVGHDYTGKYEPSLFRLYDLLNNFQGVVTVLAHWGGGLFVYELMPEVMRSFKNVYYDTAATPFLYRKEIYRICRDITGSDRILFGSDYPLIKPDRYIPVIREVLGDSAESDSILGGNAARILGL